jgi:hypothetical protein
MAVGSMDCGDNRHRSGSLSLADAVRKIRVRVPVVVVELVLSHLFVFAIGLEVGIHAQSKVQTVQQKQYDAVISRASQIGPEMRAKLQATDR